MIGQLANLTAALVAMTIAAQQAHDNGQLEVIASVPQGKQVCVTVFVPAIATSKNVWKLHLDMVNDDSVVFSGPTRDSMFVGSKRIEDIKVGTHIFYLIVYGKDGVVQHSTHRTIEVPSSSKKNEKLGIVLATIAGFVSSSVVVIIKDVLERRKSWKAACQRVAAAADYLRAHWESQDCVESVTTLMDIDATTLRGRHVHDLFSLRRKLQDILSVRKDGKASEMHRDVLISVAKEARRL